MLKQFLVVGVLSLLLSSCMEEITNVPREQFEATLIVVRNEGNMDDEINVFLDSLLVGKTYQDKISEITIPAGQHTLFFEYGSDYYGQQLTVKPNSVIATRQFAMEAYSFSRIAFDSLPEDSLDKFMKKLPIVKSNYYEAKQKISTSKFRNRLSDFQNCPLELRIYDKGYETGSTAKEKSNGEHESR